MRGWRFLAVIGLAGLAAGGCFREVKETVTTDSVSYLVVQGTGVPVTVYIDGAIVAHDLELLQENGVRFKIGRGAHKVRIVRGDRVVVDRQVYVGDGETRIVTVPAGG